MDTVGRYNKRFLAFCLLAVSLFLCGAFVTARQPASTDISSALPHVVIKKHKITPAALDFYPHIPQVKTPWRSAQPVVSLKQR